MATSDQPQSSGPSDERSKRHWSGWALAAALLIGAGLGVLVGFVLFDEERDDRPPVAVKAPTLGGVLAEPERFLGKPAILTGQVEEILSPRAFTVGEPGLLGRELLVISRTPLAAPTARSATRPILEGDFAQVSGEVRRFDRAAFERDAGISLKDEFDVFGEDLAARQGDPAVQADIVTFSARTTPVVDGATVEDIVTRPRDFYGRIASVSGRVTDALPSGALLIDDQLVALTADFGQRRPREGDDVRVVGPVRPFDPDQRRLPGRDALDEKVLQPFADRPAVVAQSIEIED